MAKRPVFEVWICQGRMCTALGAEALVDAARRFSEREPDAARCRTLRGGCWGLCEIGSNVVVRRFADAQSAPASGAETTADRLTLTGRDNETVYARMGPSDVERVLRSHLEQDRAVDSLTRAARESSLPAPSPVAARMRALRDKRRGGTS